MILHVRFKVDKSRERSELSAFVCLDKFMDVYIGWVSTEEEWFCGKAHR